MHHQNQTRSVTDRVPPTTRIWSGSGVHIQIRTREPDYFENGDFPVEGYMCDKIVIKISGGISQTVRKCHISHC